MRLLGLAVGLLLAACGDDDGPGDDAGPDVDAAPTDAGVEPVPEDPAPAEAPAALELTPCPEGWIESGTDPAECLPWPAESVDACEGATALFPGSDGCEPIGLPCPEGDWPDDLPVEGVWFVHPSGSAGAAGTRDEPLGSVAEALARANAGEVVALAQGSWNETVHVPQGVTLRGACAEGTRLWTDEPDLAAVIDVTRGDVEVRDLSVGGAQFGVLIHGRAASAHLQSVLVDGATAEGIAVFEEGHLEAADVIVRGTLPRLELLDLGRGLDLAHGGTARVVRAAIEQSHDLGVFVGEEGSTLELVDSVVRDTRAEAATGWFGRGVEAELGGVISMTRVVVERNLSAGLFAGDGTVVRLEDVRIADTAAAAQPYAVGHGIDGAGAAEITGSRVVVDRATDSGVVASEEAQIAIDDLWVRDARPDPDGDFGRGLSVQTGGRLEVVRGIVEGSRESGVFAGGSGTTLALTDTIVRETAEQLADGAFGRGVIAFDGAAVTLERVRVEDGRETGIALVGTTASLRDVVVSAIAPQAADGKLGRGVVVQDGASVTAERLEVHDCHEAGVAVIGATARLDAFDLDVHDMAGSDLGIGRSLSVQDGGVAVLTRARLRNSHELGLFASEPGSSVRGTEVQILDTATRDCAGEVCEEFGAGIAIGTYEDANVTITRFRIERAALIGLQLARGGTADLSEGVVAGCPIGANVQTEGFDTGRLADGVVYRDNERNFDGTELPLPL